MPIEKPHRTPIRARPAALLALLAIVLFPFEWLGAHWGQLGVLIDSTFPTEAWHALGHASLFGLLGLLALACYPALRDRPARYAALLLAGAGQELLQLAFKQRPVNFDDGRDLLVDACGLALAFGLAWLTRRANEKGGHAPRSHPPTSPI